MGVACGSSPSRPWTQQTAPSSCGCSTCPRRRSPRWKWCHHRSRCRKLLRIMSAARAIIGGLCSSSGPHCQRRCTTGTQWMRGIRVEALQQCRVRIFPSKITGRIQNFLATVSHQNLMLQTCQQIASTKCEASSYQRAYFSHMAHKCVLTEVLLCLIC